MGKTLKTERLEIRLTAEQKSRIETAARLSGKSIAEFGVPILVDAAELAIDEETRRIVSIEALREFSEIINRPSRRIDALAALIDRESPFRD